MERHIIISKDAELVRIPQSSLVYVSAEGNYSYIVTRDGKKHLVTFQLGQIEDAINRQIDNEELLFLRIGRSLIINTEYIYLIDTSKQLLILSDFHGFQQELTASKEALTKLKAIIESTKND
ncbi:MAG TPA: hypothetical protein DHU75_01770 [Rikenellaceae bacterium]|nr:hypothetical protein [Rikenellaceae bacterium]